MHRRPSVWHRKHNLAPNREAALCPVRGANQPDPRDVIADSSEAEEQLVPLLFETLDRIQLMASHVEEDDLASEGVQHRGGMGHRKVGRLRRGRRAR